MTLRTTVVAETIDGEQIALSECKPGDVWAVRLSIASVSENGQAGTYCKDKIFHVRREVLEKAKLLPLAVLKKEQADETPADLARRLLEMVRIEE